MTEAQNSFINSIAEYVVKYAKSYNVYLASPIIAQAINESGWGKSGLAQYHNYFGLKCGSNWNGKSVNMQTKEEYEAGTLTTITANFRVFDSMEDGIKGYFEFIKKSRYDNLHGKYITPAEYCNNLFYDGYATSRNYASSLMRIIDLYKLTDYDLLIDVQPKPNDPEEPVDYFLDATIVEDTINGKYGSGNTRKSQLEKMQKGLYALVQAKVNYSLLGSITNNDKNRLAENVINGYYKNVDTGRKEILNSIYDDCYSDIQKIVNQKLS